MKFVGQGWQYTVYDIGNNRVLKKRNTKLQAYWVMLKTCFPYTRNSILEFPYFYRSGTTEAETSLVKIMESPIEKKFFGNPLILDNGIDYEQDNVRSLEEIMNKVNLEEGKYIINKFIQFNQLLINNHLIDKSFAICKNFGINNEDEIIMIDLGEVYSSKESIANQVNKKAWKAKYVLDPLPSKLREYFCEKMDNLTCK